MTPTTMRTIQNSKLLRVEFNLRLLTALLSRVSRPVRGRDPKILGHRLPDDPDNPVVLIHDERQGIRSRSRATFRSTRKSCNFRPRPPIPRGLKPIARAAGSGPPGARSGAAATTAAFPRRPAAA